MIKAGVRPDVLSQSLLCDCWHQSGSKASIHDSSAVVAADLSLCQRDAWHVNNSNDYYELVNGPNISIN